MISRRPKSAASIVLMAGFAGVRAFAGELEILQSWPFVATKAVALDASVQPPIAFAASGGGVIAMDVHSIAKPALANSNAWGRTGGFVFDVDATPEHVFAAAGKAGLVRLARTSMTVDAKLPGLFDARAVLAFRIEDREYVVAGSQLGKLVLARSLPGPLPQPLVVEAESYLAGGVTAITVTLGARPGHATILVGTECSGLLRFDVPIAAFGTRQAVPPYLSQPTANWSPVGAHGAGPFVRAVTIDDVPAQPPGFTRAFVATQSDGVHAIDLLPDGSYAPVVGAGWPLHPGGISYAHGLALDKHDDRLAVANGPRFDDEWNWWGDCEFPWPCDGALPLEPTAPGLRIYEQIATNSPIEVGHLPVLYGSPGLLTTAPVDVAMRKVGPDELRFCLASEYLGTHVARATRPPGGIGPWTLMATGGFDHEDGVPVGSMYDALVRPGVAVYTANGVTFSAFPTNAGPALSAAPSAVTPGCISLAFDTTTTPRIFGARKIDGIVVYDVSGSFATAPKYLGMIATFGKPNGARVAPGLSGPNVPWLLVPNTLTFGYPQPAPGSLFVFDVSAADPASAIQVASWIDSVPRTYADVAYRRTGPDEMIVWMNYAPHAFGDPTFGLVTIRLKRDTISGTTTASFVSRVAVSNPGPSALGEPAGRVEYDPTNQRLYVAYGCNGVVMFDVSDPTAPTVLGSIVLPGRTALTVRVAPWNPKQLVVALIGYGNDEGLGLLDVTDGPSMSHPGALQVFDTSFQCQSIDFPPDAATERTVYFTDGRGGVYLARVPSN